MVIIFQIILINFPIIILKILVKYLSSIDYSTHTILTKFYLLLTPN